MRAVVSQSDLVHQFTSFDLVLLALRNWPVLNVMLLGRWRAAEGFLDAPIAQPKMAGGPRSFSIYLVLRLSVSSSPRETSPSDGDTSCSFRAPAVRKEAPNSPIHDRSISQEKLKIKRPDYSDAGSRTPLFFRWHLLSLLSGAGVRHARRPIRSVAIDDGRVASFNRLTRLMCFRLCPELKGKAWWQYFRQSPTNEENPKKRSRSAGMADIIPTSMHDVRFKARAFENVDDKKPSPRRNKRIIQRSN
ncbi:hypothetical protein C8R43DRAFT_956474 [Mycena crocata]|nr:hypothetical protein C8R43DRAFT_956474 [Mycena crocata]